MVLLGPPKRKLDYRSMFRFSALIVLPSWATSEATWVSSWDSLSSAWWTWSWTRCYSAERFATRTSICRKRDRNSTEEEHWRVGVTFENFCLFPQACLTLEPVCCVKKYKDHQCNPGIVIQLILKKTLRSLVCLSSWKQTFSPIPSSNEVAVVCTRVCLCKESSWTTY